MAAKYGLKNPYDLVAADEWTFDAFAAEVAKVSGQDTNGDSNMNLDDTYGLLTWNDPVVEFLSAAGEYVGKINSDGLLEFTLYTPRAEAAMAKYTDLIANTQTTINYQNYGSDGEAAKSPMFNENRAVFYQTLIGTAVQHRDMADDFGILPYPKFDATQEEYGHSVSSWHMQYFCVPYFVENAERTGIIAEALAWKGDEYLTPAYYDLTLIGNTIRDDESEAMLDIIYSSHIFDIGVLFRLAGVNKEIIKIPQNRENRFTTIYETIRNQALAEVDEINTSFREYKE
jgi:hypothetical protein